MIDHKKLIEEINLECGMKFTEFTKFTKNPDEIIYEDCETYSNIEITISVYENDQFSVEVVMSNKPYYIYDSDSNSKNRLKSKEDLISEMAKMVSISNAVSMINKSYSDIDTVFHTSPLNCELSELTEMLQDND